MGWVTPAPPPASLRLKLRHISTSALHQKAVQQNPSNTKTLAYFCIFTQQKKTLNPPSTHTSRPLPQAWHTHPIFHPSPEFLNVKNLEFSWIRWNSESFLINHDGFNKKTCFLMSSLSFRQPFPLMSLYLHQCTSLGMYIFISLSITFLPPLPHKILLQSSFKDSCDFRWDTKKF